MILQFDKHFRNDRYEILFNTSTGLEITQGVNGKEDPFVLEMPSLLDIGVMGTCKHKCPFCYQGHTNRPNMKFEDFKQIIDEASYHVNQVALGGRGDPNHHPDFERMIEYCRSKKVVPNYTTSGIDLTDKHIEISKMCGAVAVSDYGQDYTYEALDRFIKAKIKTNIHQIFTSTSFSRCLNIVLGYIPADWNFKYEGLNAVIFLLFKPHGAGKEQPNLIPSADHLMRFASHIFNPKSKHKVGMDSCLVNHVLKYYTPPPAQRMSVDTCEAARMSSYITPDMKFMPYSFANESEYAIPIGESLKEIWDNGESFIEFRKRLLTNEMTCPLGL